MNHVPTKNGYFLSMTLCVGSIHYTSSPAKYVVIRNITIFYDDQEMRSTVKF
jgi:hypothetical protein